MNVEQMEAKEKSDRKKSFENFMELPATRMLLSLVPSGDHPEAIKTILQGAFEHGWGCGAGATACQLLHAMMANKENRR